MNICTLYGRRPSELVDCLTAIRNMLDGDYIYIYVHNLGYDWVFIRRFLFEKLGYPIKQLNTKPHYPIFIEFENHIVLRDSLILSQRSIESWANTLNVEHKKAVGKWDYDKIRTQNETFNTDELEYIECDTLAGVECIDAFMTSLNKKIYSMPYTSTGIIREEVRKRGRLNNAKDWFNRICCDFTQQLKLEKVYHGGYVHANRWYIDQLISILVEAYDFSSSYPFVLLTEKYPMRFMDISDKSVEYILKYKDQYAFMFKAILINVEINYDVVMPVLQYSKCIKIINPILDNGRVLRCDYAEIYINEIDLSILSTQYNIKESICTDISVAEKEYLPRWLTDYIFELFVKKTKLKGCNPVDYAISKTKVNGVYGLHVQKPCKPNIVEDYDTGECLIDESFNYADEFIKWKEKRNSILPYQVGVWCTSYAMYNLFKLGTCCETWLYSDTDSCYGINWDKELVKQYNDKCKEKLRLNGYSTVIHNDREYWLGVAEHDDKDDSYSEFKIMGAKRYCGRQVGDSKLHITVAGVPKAKGVECLNDDINNFTSGFIFSGAITGKLTHTYFFTDDIYIDDFGNETGDSIDLSQCDYCLSAVEVVDFEKILNKDVEVAIYE